MKKLHLALFRLSILLTALPKLDAAASPYELAKTGELHRQLTLHQPQSPPLAGAHDGRLNNNIATEAVPLNPLEELRKAVDVMQSTWFEVWVGTWPTGIDWTRAVIDTHLVSSVDTLSKALLDFRHIPSLPEKTAKDIDDDINRYFSQHTTYYFGEDAFAVRNHKYDDMLWVVLGWLESLKFIKGHSDRHFRFGLQEPIPGQGRPWHGEQFMKAFAHRARIFWELASKGWDTTFCDGGMVWHSGQDPYKNAITNELFITGSVGMYLHFSGDNNTSPFSVDGSVHEHYESAGYQSPSSFDLKFLNAAVDGYEWLKNVGMINDQGLYVDGFHVRDWNKTGTRCDVRNEMVYTYNQGVLTSGLRDLWESTGNLTYLEDAHQLARNTVRATGWNLEDHQPMKSNGWAGLGRNGILEDFCDAGGYCSQDAEIFKGIFMHHLTLLCDHLPLTPRVPGKTFGAGKDLMFLHRQSCRQYTPWVAHNAKAALGTLDHRGRFGGWWGAKNGVIEEPLTDGVIDYRGDNVEVFNEPLPSTDTSTTKIGRNEGAADSFGTQNDLNDRGRGRTVETQSGGIAVLRALWEFRHNE